MSRPEDRFRSQIVQMLKPLLAFPVENTVAVGIPDICCLAGWIELKISALPKKSYTPVNVVIRPAQRLWMRNWIVQGGRAWYLVKIGEEILLFKGDVVLDLDILNIATFPFLKSLAVWSSSSHGTLVNALLRRDV